LIFINILNLQCLSAGVAIVWFPSYWYCSEFAGHTGNRPKNSLIIDRTRLLC